VSRNGIYRQEDKVTRLNSGGQTTVGLDVSDRHVHTCFIDHDGLIVEEARLAATSNALRRRFSGAERYRVILEVGAHSPWMSRLLTTLGHEVYVANARRLRAIYTNESKSDRVDAEYLARIGRLDPALLSPLTHRSAETQADLAVLRSRAALVKVRSLLANHLRGVLKSAGSRVPLTETRLLARRVQNELPPELAPALAPVVSTMLQLDERISAYDQQIEAMSRERYPETQLLRQVYGVGLITAVTFVLTVEDPTRFGNSRSIGSYLGLRPRQDDSGSLKPQLPITKAGDKNLRSLLVECSHHILGRFGHDSDLRRWGLKLAEHGGKSAKKRATVAVARKLSVLLLRLWLTGEIYEPLRNARLRGEVVPSAS
jgi:transposase